MNQMFSGTGVSAGNFLPSTAGVGTHTITYSYTDANSCTNAATTDIEVTVCTGLLGAVENTDLSVFPNPSTGIVTISSSYEESILEVYNTNGILVNSKMMTGLTNDFNLQGYASGVYTFKLKHAKGISIAKVVITY